MLLLSIFPVGLIAAGSLYLHRQAGVKLIALTGYGTPSDLLRARQAGFDAHITQPVDIDELMAAINRTSSEARPN